MERLLYYTQIKKNYYTTNSRKMLRLTIITLIIIGKIITQTYSTHTYGAFLIFLRKDTY